MTRVLIVDDHPVFRDGLAGLLATLPDVEIAGTAGTAEEALAGLRDTAPDIVLMDINLPGASGVEATRQCWPSPPATAVLVISMVDDDDSVFAALAAGARGYVLKGASGAKSPRRCAPSPQAAPCSAPASPAGSWPRRRRAPGRPTAAARRPDRARTRGPRPARRRCASNRQIARSLGVSLKTVQNHVSRILDKLQAADRTQAALRARGISPTRG